MRKLTVFLCSAPVGLGTGLLAWFLAGGAQAAIDRLAPGEAAVAALRTPRPAVVSEAYVSVADLVAAPIFGQAAASAQAEPAIRLDGVSLSRQRIAALVSIGGAPAEWLRPGEARGDVTLQQVATGRIVVDTPSGTKEIVLGQTLGGSGAVPPAVGPGPASAPDPAMAGFRSPPAPASAPVPK